MLMIWIVFFCCLLMVYVLGLWLFKLMVSVGYSLGLLLFFLLVFNFGGVVGVIGGGWLGDCFILFKVVVSFFVVGMVVIVLFGFNSLILVLYLFIIVVGVMIIGMQILLYVNMVQFYLLVICFMGFGWVFGVGCLGVIVGFLLGGVLMVVVLLLKMNFLVFVVLGLVVVLVIGIFLLCYCYGQCVVVVEIVLIVIVMLILCSV